MTTELQGELRNQTLDNKSIRDKLASPLSIGKLTLPCRLIQAPLAGYSAAPFRVITERIGKPAFTCTEMISAHDLAHRAHGHHRYLWRDPAETIVSYQLAGSDPHKLAIATQKVTQAGADIIDLNCGCPVKKIRSKQQGSKLLADPKYLYQLIRTIKDNSDSVVSIKIRVGEPYFDSDDLAVAQSASTAGADFITVHGRHWQERYDTPVRMDPIKRIKQSVTIPVFANGDVCDQASALALCQATGCDGVMIARASVGDPWLFQAILASDDQPFSPPTFAEVGAVFQEHIRRLIDLDNEKLAILQSRKLAKYYARYHPERTAFVNKAQCHTTASEQLKLIERYFCSHKMFATISASPHTQGYHHELG